MITTPQPQSCLSVPGATVNFPDRKAPPMPNTATSPYPDIPLPTGAGFGDLWQSVGAKDAHRVIMGDNRGVTDTDVIVWTSAIQFWDGSLDTDGEIEMPSLHIDGGGVSSAISNLNSDQGRELAAALLEAATELDRWAGR